MAKTTNLFGLLIFGFVAFFWTSVFKIINMYFDNLTLGITLDILMVICNLIFTYIMIRSCMNFHINTKFVEKKQKEAYDHFNNLLEEKGKKDNVVYIYPIPEPESYRKSRFRMILVTMLGISMCGFSSFLVIMNYL